MSTIRTRCRDEEMMRPVGEFMPDATQEDETAVGTQVGAVRTEPEISEQNIADLKAMLEKGEECYSEERCCDEECCFVDDCC